MKKNIKSSYKFMILVAALLLVIFINSKWLWLLFAMSFLISLIWIKNTDWKKKNKRKHSRLKNSDYISPKP